MIFILFHLHNTLHTLHIANANVDIMSEECQELYQGCIF
jgi:hypothetical protein